MSLVKDARREGRVKYERHKPEQTLLYQIIEKYYPQFLTHMGQQDKGLPKYVRSEFEEYLKCGRLEYGFCEFVVKIVIVNIWLRSVVNAEVFTPGFLPFGPAFGCSKSFQTILCPSGSARRMAKNATNGRKRRLAG